jgi:hypothetical protein
VDEHQTSVGPDDSGGDDTVSGFDLAGLIRVLRWIANSSSGSPLTLKIESIAITDTSSE